MSTCVPGAEVPDEVEGTNKNLQHRERSDFIGHGEEGRPGRPPRGGELQAKT